MPTDVSAEERRAMRADIARYPDGQWHAAILATVLDALEGSEQREGKLIIAVDEVLDWFGEPEGDYEREIFGRLFRAAQKSRAAMRALAGAPR